MTAVPPGETLAPGRRSRRAAPAAAVTGWELTVDGFDPDRRGHEEALTTLGNGFFATRGAFPEASADGVHYPGTYVGGLYDRKTTRVAGRAVENEDLVNLPNWLVLRFAVDGEWVDPARVELLEHRLTLELRQGMLVRFFRFRHPSGTTRVVQRRLVSMDQPHVGALETTFTAEDWEGTLTVRSGIDGGVVNAGVARYADLEGSHLAEVEKGEDGPDTVFLVVRTTGSRIAVAEAARTRVYGDGSLLPVPRTTGREGPRIHHDLDLHLVPGEPRTVEKVATLYTSRDRGIYEAGLAARSRLEPLGRFDDLLAGHTLRWKHLWQRFDVALDGDERTVGILRLHIFHLLCTVSENTIDLDVGIPARGLHGEAYRGHVFWDELFVLPLLDLHIPALGGALLEYRHRRLPRARRLAAEAGLDGALFPWQSGSTGREESQRLHLNPASGRWLPDHSHLQRHVNHAIAYNVWQYYETTGDRAFLRFRGAETLVEISRLLASLTTYDRSRGRYVLTGVVGPDEYHDAYPWREGPGLDNNAYTNVMTVWVLRTTLRMLEDVLTEHERAEVDALLRLDPAELDHWGDISRRLLVPFHDGVMSQFEGYERLAELDWEDYRARYGDISRLDRILEAEGDTPNRYRVSKQADVLMLLYLLPAAQVEEILTHLGYDVDDGLLRRTVEYYLARTSHGSTLSRVVHSSILARVDRRLSWRLFVEALESDVSDVQGGTTGEGIHLGAMAGTIDLLERGYSGIEPRGDVLHFDPVLPDELPRLSFTVHYRGHRLVATVTHRELTVETRPGDLAPIRISCRGTEVEVEPGSRHTWALTPTPPG